MKRLSISMAVVLGLAVTTSPPAPANADTGHKTAGAPVQLADNDRRDNRGPPNQGRSQRSGPPPGAPQGRPRYDWKTYRPGRRPPDWKDHRDFDRRTWQHNYQSQQRYRWQPYHRPQGWYTGAGPMGWSCRGCSGPPIIGSTPTGDSA